MVMIYRPFLPGLVSEERIDDRPDMPANARRVLRLSALGIIGVDSHGSTAYIRHFFSADPMELGQLPETGVWETDLTAWGGPVDRADVFTATGRHVVRFLGHETRQIGACSYAVWAIEHTRTVRGQPGRPDTVQLFRQWWAPALGVAIGVTDAAREGFGPEVPFARIASVP